jgi:hypothetical protein
MHRQSGNMLIYILGAIFLLGLLIVLVKGSFQEGSGIDSEKVLLKAQQVQSYAGELARGVAYVQRNGVSESDIRFAWPDADAAYGTYSDSENMVFAPKGGSVEYKMPPAGVNDGTAWQFHATTHFTDLGTDAAGLEKAELVAVLPNVIEAFCNQINRNVKQNIDLASITDPTNDGCVYAPTAKFDGNFASGSGDINKLDDTKLSSTPAPEACVRCESDSKFHYYKVLIAR